MTFTYDIPDSDYQSIVDQLGNVKPEDWLKLNLDSLVKQCVDSQKQKKLSEIGQLTDSEIELIKKTREVANVSASPATTAS